MFVQVHMLQSMPPGNLNRDDAGQPKRCLFGGVTRGRISSQCLKRNIRHSIQFKEAFGDNLADRTTYLPRMVADELRKLKPGISDDDLNKVKAALASKFKAEKGKGESDEAGEDKKDQESSNSSSTTDQTGQLVFFPPPFAISIAELLVKFKTEHPDAYNLFIREGKKKLSDKEKKALEKTINESFVKPAEAASESLTVDIGLFGRMTTSDLVVDVEAACQVAHAISTHEAFIESDWFTAMDDLKAGPGAAYMGTGESETYFNSAVYYKYLNLDVDALKKHLSWQDGKAAIAASVLVEAAALGTPTGKQNSFAAHGLPELVFVEASKKKRPLSYANAFLKAVEGGNGRNLMTESASALKNYIDSVASAYAPSDLKRVLFAIGPASVDIKDAERINKFDDLPGAVKKLVSSDGGGTNK